MEEGSGFHATFADAQGRLSRRVLVKGLAALPAAPAALAAAGGTAAAQETAGLSFIVFGDSRSMMYLPYRAEEREEATRLIVEMFALVLTEKVAEEVVRKEVRLVYDPDSGELVQIVMPLWSKSEITTLTVDKGWITEASVEDVKLLPGVRRTIFRLHGGAWVAREIVREVRSGAAQFVITTGDLVWWGNQGSPPSDNPYWRRFEDGLLKQLPEPDERMRQAGLPGRFFPAVGNHEVWGDAGAQALLAAFPISGSSGSPRSASSTGSTAQAPASSSCGRASTIIAPRPHGMPSGRASRRR